MFTSIPEDRPIQDTDKTTLLKMMNPGPFQFDGAPIGPFQSIQQFITQTIEWGISMFDLVPHLSIYKEDFVPSLQHFLHTYLPAYIQQHQQAFSNQNIDIQFCHCDLNPGNIMVDLQTNQITAILDWDAAGFLPMDFEWDNLEGLVSAVYMKEESEQVLKEYGFVKPEGYEIRERVTRVAMLLNYMTFWCSTWWTSKPGQRELIDLKDAELLPAEVSRIEGTELMEHLKLLGSWKGNHKPLYLEDHQCRTVFASLFALEAK